MPDQDSTKERESRPQNQIQPRHTRPWLLTTGISLIVLSVVGFATVADDLRHVGESFGVGSILIAGLTLVVASFSNAPSRNLHLPWLAVAAIVGPLVGAVGGHVVIGVAAGLVIGLILAVGTVSRAGH